jgi:hypothetical protein
MAAEHLREPRLEGSFEMDEQKLADLKAEIQAWRATPRGQSVSGAFDWLALLSLAPMILKVFFNVTDPGLLSILEKLAELLKGLFSDTK